MLLILYLFLINIVAIILYGIDKKKAENGKWRISEASLILVAVFGGAAGALIGMKVFHHKTQKKKFTRTIPILLVVWLLIIAFCIYQNHHIVVTHYEYKVSGEKAIKEDFTIVQVSDLHNQFFGFDQKYLMNKIKANNPDIIVVTGDSIDSLDICYTFAKTFFKEAVKIAPTYYITGNHEQELRGEKLNKFLDYLKKTGVIILDDDVVEIGDIILAGISEDSLGNALDESVFGSNDNSKIKVLLAHEPDYYKSYVSTGADIVFTGHVHGGQVIIPGVGGVFAPDFTFFPELYEGEHKFGDTTMYISRGLGNSLLPVRINNYPELVVVTISN